MPTSSTSTWIGVGPRPDGCLVPPQPVPQIDVDMDASTGYPVREGLGRSSALISTAVWRFGPADQVNFSEIGLIPHRDQQPIRIGTSTRCGPRRRQPALSSSSIRLLFETPSSTTICPMWGSNSFDFGKRHICGGAGGLGQADPTSLRVCAYNVLGNGLIHPNRQAHFERILPAVDADVYLFSECGGTGITRSNPSLTRGFSWMATKVGTPPRMAI